MASAVANHNYSKPATNQAVKQTNVPKIETQRVGRWMSTDEYNKMVKTGTVQMSGQNKTHVTNPADIKSYTAAPKGSVFVEFDVPVNSLSQAGKEGWATVNFPGSLQDRLNIKKGLSPMTSTPTATNIKKIGVK